MQSACENSIRKSEDKNKHNAHVKIIAEVNNKNAMSNSSYPYI